MNVERVATCGRVRLVRLHPYLCPHLRHSAATVEWMEYMTRSIPAGD